MIRWQGKAVDIDKRLYQEAHKMLENRQTDQYHDYLSVEQINFIILLWKKNACLVWAFVCLLFSNKRHSASAADGSTFLADNDIDWTCWRC